MTRALWSHVLHMQPHLSCIHRSAMRIFANTSQYKASFSIQHVVRVTSLQHLQCCRVVTSRRTMHCPSSFLSCLSLSDKTQRCPDYSQLRSTEGLAQGEVIAALPVGQGRCKPPLARQRWDVSAQSGCRPRLEPPALRLHRFPASL
jgi:hypothetical protein